MSTGLLFYYASRFVAQVSQTLLFAALFITAGTSDQAAIGLSALFIATTLAALLLGMPGGALADRVGPARGMAIGAVARAVLILACFALFHSATAAIAVAFMYSAVSQVYSPAESAMIRYLWGKAHGRVHSGNIAIQYGGQVAGVIVFAPIAYYLGGAQGMLLAAAIAGVALAATTIIMAATIARDAVEPLQPQTESRFIDTVRFFKRYSIARDALATLAVKTMITQGVIVALPLYVRNELSLGDEWVAGLVAPGILGIIAALIWSATSLTFAGSARTMRLAMIAMTVGVLALASLDYGVRAIWELSQVGPMVDLEVSLNTSFLVAVPVAFLVGAGLTMALIASRVALTSAAPVAQQSRVYAVQATLTDGLVVLPLLFMGIGVEMAGARPVLAAMGLIGVAAFVVMQHPRFAITHREPAPEHA
jgi:MFS family permease